MTDEERQKLVEGLRHAAAYNNPICDVAAEEIERLADDLSLANDAFDKSTAEIERLQNENERLTRAIKGAAHLVISLDNGKAGIDPASFS